MKKTLSAAIACLAAVVAAHAGTITVKGSDTLLVLSQRWAEEYMKRNPSTTIQVTGGGSGTGIAALINGTTDIATASRRIKSEEKIAADSAKRAAREIPVSLDALCIVVHPQNPVQSLSLSQIGKIYAGYVNNWKDVGGPNHAIVRYSRESSSGTYAFVKDEVLKGRDYAPDVQTMPGTSAVAEAVSRDPWAIGYGGVAYFAQVPGVKILSVKKDDTSPAVSPLGPDGRPNNAVVYDGSYPLTRQLFFYTPGDAQGEKKAFIDFVLGTDGQKIVEAVEYIPLPRRQ
jgi:phosphate transport system substrate-binding protein